jgi:hypothetical protein
MVERTKIAGLPIQQEWTVVGVREGKETDNSNGGKLKAFYVDFADAPDVYWRRDRDEDRLREQERWDEGNADAAA